MTSSLASLTDSLVQAVEAEDAEAVHATAGRIRSTIDDRLLGRELEPGAEVLETKRRLLHRLEVIETKAHAKRFDKAQEDLEDVRELADRLDDQLAGLDPAPEEPEGPPVPLRGLLAIWTRELHRTVGQASGILWAGVILAAVVLASSNPTGLPSRPVNVLLVLAPLAGLHTGLDLLSGDRESGRLGLIAARPVSRAGLVAAKALGAWTGLAAIVAGPALLGHAGIQLVAGQPASPLPLAGLGVGVWLVAGSFAGLGLLLSEVLRHERLAIGAGLASYALLGPLWLGAFEAGAAGAEGAAAGVAFLASPVAATREALVASTGGAAGWAALLVPGAWLAACVAWSAWRARHRGLV